MRQSGPLGIGMIGAGMIGQAAHLANFVGLNNCKVVALAELRPALGREAATRFGIDTIYPDHELLLNDPRVQAVIVVTRRHATGPIVEAALRTRRHVLSEKPMAHTVDQAVRLIAAVGPGINYAVGYMKRHDSGVRKAKQQLDRLVRSGELGPIQQVRSWCYEGDIQSEPAGYVMTTEQRPDGLTLWPVAPAWVPEQRTAEFASFLNVQIHMLNLLRYLFDETPTVRHVDLTPRPGRLCILEFGGFDATHQMVSVSGCPWEEGVEVVFARGRLILQLPPPMARGQQAEAVLYAAGAEPTRFAPDDGSWAFQRQAAAFVTDCLEERSSIASAQDSLSDMVLAEAIWLRELGLA